MYMIRNKIILFVAISFFGLYSCSDYLEPQQLSIIQQKDIYKNLNYIQQMWVNSYSYLPNGYSSVLRCASDEAEAINDQSDVQRFNLGNWTKYSNPDDSWTNCYNGIRQCCEIMENLPNVTWEQYKYSDPVEYKRRTDLMVQYYNEARFLKVFYYFELIKRYGGVPLVNKKLYLDNDSDMYFLTHVKRNTFDECVNYIVSECDSVAPDLPLSYEVTSKGRATKGAALALKSRVLLYAASDLYNQDGNTNPYIGYVSGDRQKRWLAAANAANVVIALGSYILSTPYRDLFVLQTNVSNQEIIWQCQIPNSNALEKENYPIGYEGGNTGSCPSGNLVDAYEMSNGKIFDWAVNGSNPYTGRDPRLKASILINNEVWAGRTVETWQGGRDGIPRRYATKTGYYLKKILVDNLDLQLDQKSTRQWIYFRFGEILLNYAEAANQYGGPDYKVSGGLYTAKQAIDKIRARVSMPDVNTTFANRGISINKDEFLKLIYNERRVELAFENHRWWDIHRWMKAEETLGGKISGVSVLKNNVSGTFTYTPVETETRIFDKNKMYLYPIPQSEIVKSNGNLEQNPNW